MPNWGELLGQHEGLPPPSVPGYTILELIGGHGQSEVYLAEDAAGERVALKRWKLPSARAQLELEALRSLRVPGVVAVLGWAEDQALGLPCLIMEFVDAPHLLAASPRLEVESAAAVVRDVARTLIAVHARDLVHRDIKPANVLLRENGSVVLVDFGVVKTGQASVPEPLTLTGSGPIGTLPYMAPEQLDLLEDPVGAQADVYALGATLFQCLSGVVPFETNGAFERRERKVWKDPPAGAEIAHVPRELRRIVSRCLAYRPQDRPQGAAAVADALEAYLSGQRDRLWLVPLVLAGLFAVFGGALASFGLPPPAPPPASSSAAAPTPPPGSAPESPPSASPALGALPEPPEPARQLVLQPGPLAGKDAYVSSVGLYPNDNFGPAPTLRVGFRPPSSGQSGEYRALLQFDLSRLPSSAEVVAAELWVWIQGATLGALPQRVQAAPVLPSGARTPWIEGTGRIDRLLDGVAWSGTFRSRLPSASSDLPAFSKPDAGPRVSVAALTSGQSGWVKFPLRDLAQGWVERPEANLGLELSAEGFSARGHWSFASSDAARPERRPQLRLSYRGPPARPPATPGENSRSRAKALLSRATRHAAAGEGHEAYAALTRAALLAPGWGAPYYQRARLGRSLGHLAMVRIDALQALYAEEPELNLAAVWELAQANLAQPGSTAQGLGLALVTALSADPAFAERAATRFRVALPRVRARLDLGSREVRLRAEFELASLIASRARSSRPSRSPALHLVRGLVLEALGDARALRVFGEARRLGPTAPLVLALVASRRRVTPRSAALRIRVLLLLGKWPEAAALCQSSQARWPLEERFRALATLAR